MSKYNFWLLVIILIALALRLYNLTYHSLWFDEAVSVHWAKQSIPRILEVGFTLEEDRLPPLYYLMLKGWSGLFGLGETSIRGLSVVFGVLLIPVTAGIAHLLFTRRAALYSAALIAVNPFLIWYSQEARMYAPAVFFSTFAVWSFLQYCRVTGSQVTGSRWQVASGRWRPVQPFIIHSFDRLRTGYSSFIILFTLAAIAGLYSHLYTGFLLPALGFWLIISYPHTRRLWLAFAISGAIITLAYTPILLALWRFSGQAAPGNPLTGIAQRAWWLLQSFIIWKAALSPLLKTSLPIITILFVLFAYLKPKTQNSKLKTKLPSPRLLITLLLVLPFIIANILLFRNHLAFFGERYFIVITPWLLILAAVGADNLGTFATRHSSFVTRRSSPVTPHSSFIIHHSSFIILLILTALPLPGQWSMPAAKEMWRQSVAYLAQTATPDDGILIHPDWVRYPFQYYFQGPGQTYAAFSNVAPNTALDGPLQGVVGNHKVIWLLQSHIDSPDPDRRVEQWFAARYPLVTELYPPGIILKGYAPGYQLDALPPEATPANIEFENGLYLAGYQADTTASATDERFHPPSGWVHVTLYWSANQPVTTDAMPFVHLVGPEGVWGASLDRPGDALKLFPPTHWPTPAPVVRQDLDINLNPATPPGVYQLVVGLRKQQKPHFLAEVEIQR